MTAPKEVKRRVERFRDRVHSVLEVASEEEHIDSARGHRPRGVLVCGGHAGEQEVVTGCDHLVRKRSERK